MPPPPAQRAKVGHLCVLQLPHGSNHTPSCPPLPVKGRHTCLKSPVSKWRSVGQSKRTLALTCVLFLVGLVWFKGDPLFLLGYKHQVLILIGNKGFRPYKTVIQGEVTHFKKRRSQNEARESR